MLALLDPSRLEIPEYANYLVEIEAGRRRVNRRARRGGDRPAARGRLSASIAAYAEYDVLFVNPIFDGLNLVAKEGPLLNERNGVLVLSENAGAADELAPWALVVSPFDIGEQADALHSALELAGARSGRRAWPRLKAHVRAHDIGWWAEGLFAALGRALGGYTRLRSARDGCAPQPGLPALCGRSTPRRSTSCGRRPSRGRTKWRSQ